MKTGGGSDVAKRRAGERAAEDVEDGMVVGLGTGSTTAYAIDAIGRALEDGRSVRGVPTSFQSRQRAIDCGIPLVGLDEVDGVDLAIDGADQVTDDGDLIKGGGAAHAREKFVAAAADRFVVVADSSKLTTPLERPVPLEVLPDALPVVETRVRDLEGEPVVRAAECKDGPVVTDNGNLVLDCAFGPIAEPGALARDLAAIPGVVEHGLFVGMADAVFVGTESEVESSEF